MHLNFTSSAFSFTLSVLILGMSAGTAYAYLDAGTGSMILQVLLGGLAGLAIAGKLYWYKLKMFFGYKPKTDTEDQPTAEPKA